MMLATYEKEMTELRRKLAQAEADALSLALRLYSEPVGSMSPECQEAMERWRPKCEALVAGKQSAS